MIFSLILESDNAKIDAAYIAEFRAPQLSKATQPTGIPGGICTIDIRASIPFNELDPIGTPITGKLVIAATTPGRAAAPPAAVINTFIFSFEAFET